MWKPERIIFAGLRRLAARCLAYLIEEVGPGRIAGVLTARKGDPDWWPGEGEPEISEIAERHGIPLVESKDLHNLRYDLLLSVLWERLFPGPVLERATLGAINLHPGPLPNYRGCFTRVHAILNAETEFGTSIHEMELKPDMGDVLGRTEFPVFANDTARSLDARAMSYAYPLFCETWQRLVDGSVIRENQADLTRKLGRQPRYFKLASLEPLLSRPSAPLTPDEADRHYRAFSFYPKVAPPGWLTEYRTPSMAEQDAVMKPDAAASATAGPVEPRRQHS
ncbi:MAG: hypothetical protein MI785_22250 [Kiloniellales bacterium]|nr:hypothetical protein [Kiloniellales bacterium]